MAYTVTDWRNGETALSARNMTHIEQGIKDAHDAIDNMFTKAELFNAIYPVGSIYMSVNNTDPGTLFGGTWVEWGQGRVPVGVGTSDRAFTANETGGSSNAVVVAHNHTASFKGNAVSTHTHSGPSHYHSMSHDHKPDNTSNAFLTISRTTPVSRINITDYIAIPNSGDFRLRPNREYMNIYTGVANIERNNDTAAPSNANTGSAGTGATGPAGGHTPSGTVTVAERGSVGTNMNLQPYITCYMWKRTS